MSYFIVSGPGRCGTYWLTKTLSQFDDMSVWHDIFFPENFEDSVKKFQESKTKHTGTVSGPTRYVIKELNKTFKPKWGFLLRNPLETIRSHVEMMYQIENINQIQTTEPVLRRVKRTAHLLLSDLELSLKLFKSNQINLKYFLLEKITTPEGFQEILEWLEIKNTYFILPNKINEMPDHDRKTNTSDWPQETIDYISEIWNCCPHLKKAYQMCGAKHPTF
jgi:hypothetical protein